MKPVNKKLVFVLSLFYLAVLCWIILLKMGFSFQSLDRVRMLNFVPLAESYYGDGRLNASEILNNVLIFVPLGVYLTMLQRNRPVIVRIMMAFGLSLLFETVQYVFAIGVSDVTDLIGNTAGGAFGVLGSAFLYRIVKREGTVDRILAILLLIGSICFAALAALLLIAN